MLSDDCYLQLAICDLLSDSFYLKLATTCKNLFLSLVVVRLVIFFIQNILDPKSFWTQHFFGPNIFWTQYFLSLTILAQLFFLEPKNFRTRNFFWPGTFWDHFFQNQHFFRPKKSFQAEHFQLKSCWNSYSLDQADWNNLISLT